jgi:hypothetical protein
MNVTELAFTLAKNANITESLRNHTATDRKEGEQLEDRRSVGESSCNCGDGTDQRVQSLIFRMMINIFSNSCNIFEAAVILFMLQVA